MRVSEERYTPLVPLCPAAHMSRLSPGRTGSTLKPARRTTSMIVCSPTK